MDKSIILENRVYTLEELFTTIHPNKEVEISIVAPQRDGTYGRQFYLVLPDIELFCDNDKCKGFRHYRSIAYDIIVSAHSADKRFITYICKNCDRSTKTFAVSFIYRNEKSGTAIKLGEIPQFGSTLPTRLISLVGPDRDYFLKGWRAENQGMGIGAFAYYRRVVENQKARIIEEIIKVAKKINAPLEAISNLEMANKENQFSKAVESIKVSIPEVLLIEGRNPLILLHNALSEGMHELSDETCLELGRAIRLVLTELSEKMGQALKDQAELTSAVSRLIKKQ